MKRLSLLIPGLLVLWIADGLSAQADSHDDSFSQQGLFKADVSALKDTQLVAHPDVPLTADENFLWCGTLQLAWNKAIGLVGEKLHFTQQPHLVDLLNREDFTDADLAPSSYVALADFERNHAEDEIRAALEKTFNGSASPELIPPVPPHPTPDDFLAYAYLYKNLSFATPFWVNQPLAFGSHSVANFGFRTNLHSLPPAIADQVIIRDYQSDDNFVVQLKIKKPEDELILAKVPPGATLQATIQSVLKRAAQEPVPPTDEDELAIPKLNFDLRGDFPKLEGLILQPGPHARVKGLETTSVKQLIRFQFNESGAILKSEAAIGLATTAMAPEYRPQPHRLIFDRPFLILLKQAKSDKPYFALWVGNASLLMPAK
jgi:hypothetical protein